MGNNDVVLTLRRNQAEAAEREAVNAELSLRQLEIMADGPFAYRPEVTTSMEPARAQAEKLRGQAERIKDHAKHTETVTAALREEMEKRLDGFEFQLVQQKELHEFADVYGLDEESMAVQVGQLEAGIQALTEWLDAHPKPTPSRAARREKKSPE